MVNINWNNNYPWEIKLDPDVKDKDMKVLPHILDVSIVYQPIHNFTPERNVKSPFILPQWTTGRQGISNGHPTSTNSPEEQWLSYGIWGTQNEEERKKLQDLNIIKGDIHLKEGLNWREHRYGQSIKNSKSLRVYIEEK